MQKNWNPCFVLQLAESMKEVQNQILDRILKGLSVSLTYPTTHFDMLYLHFYFNAHCLFICLFFYPTTSY